MNNLPAVHSMSDLEKMATAIVKSNLFGVKSVEQAVTLMLVAQAEGLHPATAARDYHVIQGRPALKADAMLARFQQANGRVDWEEYTDTRVCGAFSHPQSPKPVKVEWTIEMARKIGLAGKDNWKNYPRAMLRARVISEGVRTCYPAIATGVYTPEEIMDMPKERDVTPVAGALQALPSKERDIVTETADQVIGFVKNDQLADAYALWQDSNFDADHEVAFWSCIPDSKIRAALKEMQAREGAKERNVISPAKHKRLEAIIKEFKLDRQGLKDWTMLKFSKAHFTELTNDEYEMLDTHISSIAKAPAAPSHLPPAGTPPDSETAAVGLINAAELKAIEIVVEMKGIKGRFDTRLRANGIKSPDQIPAHLVAKFKQWVEDAE